MEFRSCSWCRYIYPVQNTGECPYCGYAHGADAGKRALRSAPETAPKAVRETSAETAWKKARTVA